MKKLFNNVLMDTLIAFYSLVLVGGVIFLPKFVNELIQEDEESVCDAEWSTDEHPDSENTVKQSDAFFSNTSNMENKVSE